MSSYTNPSNKSTNWTIRQEENSDHNQVFGVVETAFKNVEYSDHTEQFLVDRLRKSESFIPELSLVVEIDGLIVGHILLTRVKIKNEIEEFDSLALAPLSVLPDYQGRGIGGELIHKSHEGAVDLGYKSIMVLGHENYYKRFGYKEAGEYGIEFPFEVPKENCMAIELIENGLSGESGLVVYPKEFYE